MVIDFPRLEVHVQEVFPAWVGLKSDEMGNVGDIFPVVDECIFNGIVVGIA